MTGRSDTRGCMRGVFCVSLIKGGMIPYAVCAIGVSRTGAARGATHAKVGTLWRHHRKNGQNRFAIDQVSSSLLGTTLWALVFKKAPCTGWVCHDGGKDACPVGPASSGLVSYGDVMVSCPFFEPSPACPKRPTGIPPLNDGVGPNAMQQVAPRLTLRPLIMKMAKRIKVAKRIQ